MDESEKVNRLACLYGVDKDEAKRFVRMWEEMKLIDRDEAEEDRVAHAREMSKPKETNRG